MPGDPSIAPLGLRRRELPGLLLAFGGLSLLAFADGGFFPTVWRAATAGFLCVAALAFVLRWRVSLTRAQLLVVGALGALAVWTALSASWSPAADASLLEAQRTLVYVTLALAAAAVAGSLLEGTLAALGLVCAYAVGQRLVRGPPDPPDPFEGTLLQEPLGYANALGGLAAIGLAIAIVRAVSGHRRLPHGLLACLFAVTLILTGSRGGWLAAFVGTGVALALCFGRSLLARALAAGAAAVLALALSLSAGSLVDDFASRGGERPWYWHVAWAEVADAPLVGKGAGTFELAWLERQPIPASVHDAHSLYLELLAELGIVGLALLGLALAPPLLAGFRGGSAAAAGGYVAFLAHAGLDWDWEFPAVTGAGLLCGAALLVRENASFGLGHRLTGCNRQEGAS